MQINLLCVYIYLINNIPSLIYKYNFISDLMKPLNAFSKAIVFNAHFRC